MMLYEQEQRLFLECLRAHAEEGFHLLGQYGCTLTGEEACEMGRRLCISLSIPLEGRDWLKPGYEKI